jgi:hypothetical protein
MISIAWHFVPAAAPDRKPLRAALSWRTHRDRSGDHNQKGIESHGTGDALRFRVIAEKIVEAPLKVLS